ncbi:MAG: putative acetyltransferase [Flavobacteriaceae bacterium]
MAKIENITIRKIEIGDNKELAKLIRGILTEFGIDKPGTVFTDPTTDHLYELFDSINAAYWVAEMDGKIVGGCGMYPTKGLASNCTELVKLYVDSKARGLRLGRRLMEITLTEAEVLGYTSVYLETLPELASAIGLYESLGFISLDKPLGDSGHFACNLWMLKAS